MGTFGFCVVGRKWETVAELAAALLIFPHFPSFCIWVSHSFWKCMWLECDVCVMIYSKIWGDYYALIYRHVGSWYQVIWKPTKWVGSQGSSATQSSCWRSSSDSFFSDAQQVMIALILVMFFSKCCCGCNFLFPRYLFAFEFTSKHNINL